jgi:hypothetical protein
MINFNTIRSIDLQEWDGIVEQTYGRPYSFQQQDGCKSRGVVNFTVPTGGAEDFENDTIPEKVNGDEMGVSFQAWLARDPKQKLNSDDKWDREHGLTLFWERNFYPHMDMIVDDLHAKGLLPEGKYQIVIDW